MEKYNNRYRIKSVRADWWDYANAASYFVTICTKDRIHYFGKVENKRMNLSICGVLADVFWHEIPKHAKNFEINAFVVMPNHIHGILTIVDKNSSRRETCFQMSKISPTAGSLAAIIRSYKAEVTKTAKRLGIPFAWQARFHDRIIRNPEEYEAICQYIANNPVAWEKDSFYP